MLNQTTSNTMSNRGAGMLGKLLRYEFQATARLYLPLYLVVIVFALIGRFSLHGITWRVVSNGVSNGFQASVEMEGAMGQFVTTLVGMVITAYVLGVLGAFVVHTIITIQRFWKNLMGDEGYLMFTLPVSTDQLLWSKAIPALTWGFGTILVVAVSVVIIAWTPEGVEAFLRAIRENFAPQELVLLREWFPKFFQPAFWVILPLAWLVDGLGGIFALYTAMAIGHTVPRHKIWASIGGYFAIGMIEGTAASILSTGLLPMLFRAEELPQEVLTSENFVLVADVFGGFMSGTMLLSMVISVIALVACYFVARYLLNTQLNLE